ncbi:hypothetical protein [Streptomyces zaomyceticus]|uniref:hypothetical protein n=1 Tax=Streptomyces zaomyceticus TaxID=68286 RepID=UPI002E21F786
MLSNKTGGPGAKLPGSTSRGRDLPAEIQYDMDRVADVVAAGFKGREWDQMAGELYVYAFKTLHKKMRHTGELMELVAKSQKPLVLSEEDRSTLHRDADERTRIALMTINVALETFPAMLAKGGYNPAKNPGKNGKHKQLKSFFVTRCGLVFPRVFYTWKEERTDRFIRHVNEHKGDGMILAHSLGQTGAEPVPADVAALCDILMEMIDGLRERNRAVWHMAMGLTTPGDIADALEIKVGDVNNALYTLRTKVKKLVHEGELVVPPSITAEWARRHEQDAAKKTRKEAVR